MPDGPTPTKRRGSGRLLGVEPQTVPERPSAILLFGGPGVRKTWISSQFPHCYFIDTEDGANLKHYRANIAAGGGAYMGTEQGSLDFDTVIDQVITLGTVKHHYRTLVIDSISKLWAIALSDEQEALGTKDAFGAYKKAPTRKYNSLIKWLKRLDMTVLIIAQQKELWGLDENKQRTMIGYTYDGQDKLEHDLNLSLRVFKNGPSSYAQVHKTRLEGFLEGEVFPWSYDEFANRYGRALIEREATPIVLASPEQLAEMQRLLTIVRVSDDWETKIFKAANVDAWTDMESENIEKILAMLKSKINPELHDAR